MERTRRVATCPDRRRTSPRSRPTSPEVVIDPPDRTFTETAIVDLGDRRVELRYLGRGHTDHDIVIGVPGAGVLFAGDLLENGAVPWFGDGYPLDWPETAYPRRGAGAVGVVVPGHGDHAGPGFADRAGDGDRRRWPSWPGASTPAS